MNDERRQTSLELILVEVGKIQNMADNNNKLLFNLDGKLGIQNGRVSKLEHAYSFMRGCVTVLILLVVPVVIKLVADYILGGFYIGGI